MVWFDAPLEDVAERAGFAFEQQRQKRLGVLFDGLRAR